MSRLAIVFLVVVTLGMAFFLAWLGWRTLPSNPMGWFLLMTGLAYFFGVIVVYWVRRIPFWEPRAEGRILQEEQHDISFWFIVLGMLFTFYVPPLEYLYTGGPLPRTVWTQAAGLLLAVLGSALFLWARRTLGKYYSGHLAVLDGQPLVMHGPYGRIRHPAYAGYLLIALGISIGYSSMAGLVLFLGLLFPSVVYRIQIEEDLLASQFGARFSGYQQTTKRLFPYIW